MPLYLYGVVPPDADTPDALDLVQPASGALRVVVHGEVAALVGAFGSDRALMTPRNVEAHHDVVERAASASVVLPARFGVVVDTESALRDELLAPRGAELARDIRAFENRTEVRVTASYVGDTALEEAVASHPGLRRLSRRVRSRSSAAGYYDRIALGELAVQQLAALQERDTHALIDRVRRRAVAYRVLASGETTGTRVAFLVDHDRLDAFLASVERFAEEQAGRMSVEAVGPLAPWDFVDDGGSVDRSLSAATAGGDGAWAS